MLLKQTLKMKGDRQQSRSSHPTLVSALSLWLLLWATSSCMRVGAQDWQTAVTLHNQYRAAHCAPALAWDAELAAFAQQTAAKLCPTGVLQHSSPAEQPVPMGENLYLSYDAGDADAKVAAGLQAWYNEESVYNYQVPGFGMATGHFTQLVWVQSTKVGCGASICTSNGVADAMVLSCNYATPGNVDGEFPSNVLDGTSCTPALPTAATTTPPAGGGRFRSLFESQAIDDDDDDDDKKGAAA